MLRILLMLFMLFISVPAEAGTPERIVSLAPQLTEILYALGLGDNIVGVTNFCDYPPDVKEKPSIGGMSNPSLEAVVSLRPDIVMMSTDGNPKEFQSRLESLNIKHHVFTARRIHELPEAVREIGRVLEAEDSAERLASRMEGTLIKYKEAGRPGRPLKVLFIVWPEPLIVAGPETAADDAILLLGHQNIAHGAGLNYPKYSIEAVIRQAPDVIVIGGMGQKDMNGVSAGLLDRFKSTPAVKNGKVHYLGNGLMRLGPRMVEGIEEMAEILNK